MYLCLSLFLAVELVLAMLARGTAHEQGFLGCLLEQLVALSHVCMYVCMHAYMYVFFMYAYFLCMYMYVSK